mmetsp:Transcript_33260/g.103232  ORF Transcript_33260/g.103232 Transcript_33260/m.103232 type:complete len:203 (-) Transcript_33260:9-617(-)
MAAGRAEGRRRRRQGAGRGRLAAPPRGGRGRLLAGESRRLRPRLPGLRRLPPGGGCAGRLSRGRRGGGRLFPRAAAALGVLAGGAAPGVALPLAALGEPRRVPGRRGERPRCRGPAAPRALAGLGRRGPAAAPAAPAAALRGRRLRTPGLRGLLRAPVQGGRPGGRVTQVGKSRPRASGGRPAADAALGPGRFLSPWLGWCY